MYNTKKHIKCYKSKMKHRAKWLPYFKFKRGKVTLQMFNTVIKVNFNISISKAA